MKIIERQDGVFVANAVFAATCGCGSLGPDTRSLLSMAGVGDVVLLSTTLHPDVKAYFKQIGLVRDVPSLGKSKHAILYNPFTGKYVNLLDAKHTPQLIKNVYTVARGL